MDSLDASVATAEMRIPSRLVLNESNQRHSVDGQCRVSSRAAGGLFAARASSDAGVSVVDGERDEGEIGPLDGFATESFLREQFLPEFSFVDLKPPSTSLTAITATQKAS